MRIVVDENIPQAAEAFGALGEVVARPGRVIARDDLRDADALIVRSVTRVDAALLEGTPVRFIGTATIGTDHVDRAWLAARGIAFADAAGCNAWAVVQWTVAALLELLAPPEEHDALPCAGRALGIVGVGNIGGRLSGVATALGFRVLASDPPRERAGDAPPAGVEWAPLGRLLDEADALTLHTPLAREGGDATFHLIDAAALARLATSRGAAGRPALLLNAARGAIVDNAALREALERGALAGAALDVFEGEPTPDAALVARCALATPHVAGYTLEGKLNGTAMTANALRRHLGLLRGPEDEWRPHLPPPEPPTLEVPASLSTFEALRAVVRQTYDIRTDDRALRAALAAASSSDSDTDRVAGSDRAAWARAFDTLRRDYPPRREFSAYGVTIQAGASIAIQNAFRRLGFAA